MSNDIKKNQLGRLEQSFSTIPHSPTKQNQTKHQEKKENKIDFDLISFLSLIHLIKP